MSPQRLDRLLLLFCQACALLTASLVVLLVVFLISEALPTVSHLGLARFVFDDGWFPSGFGDVVGFNLMPMIAGSACVTLGAILLATPLGVGAGLFLHDVAPPSLGKLYRKMLELLAGIPSVIFGFWGLVVLVPILGQWRAPGTNLLAGILILAAMVLPTIALNADVAIAAVPQSQRQAAAALGLSRNTVLLKVILPAARPGLLTGIVLALARALGETMAVLMVCGNVIQVPKSVFDPVRTLTANIALEMAYAQGDHRGALFFGGFILLVLVWGLMVLARSILVGRHG